jgi:hypothetical protein
VYRDTVTARSQHWSEDVSWLKIKSVILLKQLIYGLFPPALQTKFTELPENKGYEVIFFIRRKDG